MTPDPNIKFVKDFCRYNWDRLTNHVRVQEGFPWGYDQAQDALKNETVWYTIRSDKDSHFTSDIINGNSDNENLTGLAANKWRVKRVKCQLVADAARAFDIWFAKKDTYQTVDLDTDSVAAQVTFIAADGKQANSASYPQYYYDSGALDIPMEDLDGTYEAHTMLVWRDANAYDPTDPGTDKFIVEVEYEPGG